MATAFPGKFERLDSTLAALLQVREPMLATPSIPPIVRRVSSPRATATFNFSALAAMIGSVAFVAVCVLTWPTGDEGAPAVATQVTVKPVEYSKRETQAASKSPPITRVAPVSPVDVAPASAPPPVPRAAVATVSVTSAPAKIEKTVRPGTAKPKSVRPAEGRNNASVAVASTAVHSVAEPTETPSVTAKPGKASGSIKLAAIVKHGAEAGPPPASKPPLTFVEIRPVAPDQRATFSRDGDESETRAAQTSHKAKDEPDRKTRLDSLDAIRNLRRQW